MPFRWPRFIPSGLMNFRTSEPGEWQCGILYQGSPGYPIHIDAHRQVVLLITLLAACMQLGPDLFKSPKFFFVCFFLGCAENTKPWPNQPDSPFNCMSSLRGLSPTFSWALTPLISPGAFVSHGMETMGVEGSGVLSKPPPKPSPARRAVTPMIAHNGIYFCKCTMVATPS